MKKYFKASIIITAENQEKYIERAINSCLKQTIGNIEIIVAFSRLKNIATLKEKFFFDNVTFLRVNKKYKTKTQDQLHKIYKSLLIAKGNYIFLMDGDDAFKKDKIKKNFGLIKNKNILLLDNFETINDVTKKIKINTMVKKNKLYQYFINPWPKNFCTSCISLNKRILLNFFKKIKIEKYEYLAIDALLVIYFDTQSKLVKNKQILTKKYFVENSVDSFFLGFFNKFYWLRRLEQHNYYNQITNKKDLNLDMILTRMICFFFKKKL